MCTLNKILYFGLFWTKETQKTKAGKGTDLWNKRLFPFSHFCKSPIAGCMAACIKAASSRTLCQFLSIITCQFEANLCYMNGKNTLIMTAHFTFDGNLSAGGALASLCTAQCYFELNSKQVTLTMFTILVQPVSMLRFALHKAQLRLIWMFCKQVLDKNFSTWRS